eukprot:scaffold6115_cov43-Attheya_sp.AAC.1
MLNSQRIYKNRALTFISLNQMCVELLQFVSVNNQLYNIATTWRNRYLSHHGLLQKVYRWHSNGRLSTSQLTLGCPIPKPVL